MSLRMLPLATEPGGTTRIRDPAPLLEELATLRREHAALRDVQPHDSFGHCRAAAERYAATVPRPRL